jgi:hypothetical protein
MGGIGTAFGGSALTIKSATDSMVKYNNSLFALIKFILSDIFLIDSSKVSIFIFGSVSILLHIFANNANQRNNIIDTLLVQKDNSFWLYDVNDVAKNNAYLLTRNGTINPSGVNYNTLVSNFPLCWSTIKNASLSELNNITSSLYNGIVRWSIEIFP